MREKTMKNPVGRPPNSGEKQQAWAMFVSPHKERILKAAVQSAVDGEPTMMKFFAERMVGKNPLSITLDLRGTPQEKMNKLIEYYCTGEIQSDDALKMASIIKESVLLEKMEAVMERMSKLEEWIAEKKAGITFDGDKDNA